MIVIALGMPIAAVMSWLSRGRERMHRHRCGDLQRKRKLRPQECGAKENHSNSDTLYFTAGPNEETNGLFGTITPVSKTDN